MDYEDRYSNKQTLETSDHDQIIAFIREWLTVSGRERIIKVSIERALTDDEYEAAQDARIIDNTMPGEYHQWW